MLKGQLQRTCKWERKCTTKEKKSSEWYGPGKIMLIEGQVITVKHGNAIVKVSTVNLIKVPNIGTNKYETQK